MALEGPQQTRPHPDPAIGPDEVVRIQLQALQHNDKPEADSGIATAFHFASPANRAATGPLPRFTAMLHNPFYAAMLHYKAAQTEPVEVQGDRAQQTVMLLGADGHTAVYVFMLSRQVGGPYSGCWMTDGVRREG